MKVKLDMSLPGEAAGGHGPINYRWNLSDYRMFAVGIGTLLLRY